jgi:hypothetical protein
MVKSKRHKNDGCVFFGSSNYVEGNGIDTTKRDNDIILGDNLVTNQGNTVIGRRHFFIRYRMDTKGYYIKDTGEGSGTFVRIDRPLVSYEIIWKLRFVNYTCRY